MNIGVNGRAFSLNNPGGAVQTARNITSELANDDRDEVILFGHESLSKELGVSRVVSDGFVVDSQLFGLMWEQFVPPILSRESGIDVLFCPNGNGPLYPTSVPTVVVIHDILNYLGYSTWAYEKIQRLRVPWTVRAADRIITVSAFTKHELVDRLGVPEQKIEVVHNGISETFLSNDPGTPFPLPERYLLYVGGMHNRKNVDGIVEAYDRLRDKYAIEQDLVLIGPKDHVNYSSVDLNWDRLTQREDIHLPGYRTELELKHAYTNADVFLFPSRYEGFGIPPLEAMACGTPVVASDRSSLPEILGDAAILVDPDNPESISSAVLDLVSDDSLVKELVARGEKHSARFRWERVAEETRRVLAEVSG